MGIGTVAVDGERLDKVGLSFSRHAFFSENDAAHGQDIGIPRIFCVQIANLVERRRPIPLHQQLHGNRLAQGALTLFSVAGAGASQQCDNQRCLLQTAHHFPPR